MSEAEKKWQNWDFENGTNDSWDYAETASKAREAYKAALKREIEKRNKDNDYLHQWTTSEILELLDTVEP